MGDELLLNFGAKFQRSFMFHMCNYKIAMATFHTSLTVPDGFGVKE